MSIWVALERCNKATIRHGGGGGVDDLGYIVYANVMLLNTRHLADLFGISPSTVKKYSGMYGQFLSEKARPQQERAHRLFDTDDLKVFSYVVQQTKLNIPHDDIILALANGARADIPSQYGEYSLSIDKSEQLLILQTRVTQLQSEVEILKGERDRRIAAEGQVMLLERQLEKVQEKLDDAKETIVQLKMKFGGED